MMPFGSAHFSRAESRLTLYVKAEIPGDSHIDVTIPSSMGIQIPAIGVVQKKIRLMATAEAGNMEAPGLLVDDVPYIGSFMSSTALSYSPQIAVLLSTITFKFVPQMTISGGEQVVLHLQDFNRDDSPNDLGNFSISSAPACFQEASWSADSDKLVLTAHPVLCNTSLTRCATCSAFSVTVTIGQNSGLKLPLLGHPRNDASLIINSNAAAGPVLPVPIVASPAIPAVIETEVQYGDAVAALRQTSITIFLPPYTWISAKRRCRGSFERVPCRLRGLV